MNDQVREQMSALMDSELPEVERELLLRRIHGDPALAAHWSRLHLMRDGLRTELPRRMDPDFAARVSVAVQREPALAVGPRATRGWGRPLSGLAVAASVAGLAFLGLQYLGAPEPATGAAPVAAHDQGVRLAQAGTRWDRPEAAPRLNAYLVNHNEYAAGTPLQGMMSYVRIAGYDAEP